MDAQTGAAFLGVERSLTGKRWVGPTPARDRAAAALHQSTALPPALCQVLARREVAADEVEAFLEPQLRHLLPDPRTLKDMQKAAERFLRAVARKERIAIFADYDVDGGSSAALIQIWLRQMGQSATLYVPDRIDEGYGPSDAAMTKLAAAHDLIVCVDCGTLSHGPITAAQGADVIVLDHHLGGETLPSAFAVVNPNRQDETGELAHLCAAAVVFLMLVEAGRQLREAGRSGPDLLALLDLVALATVADVAPLVGVNRAFVVQGLKVMARRARPGLVALCDRANLQTAPEAYHLGYVLGPRINAGGRVGRAELGARLLASEDPNEAAALAERLEALNAERQGIEASVRAAAIAQVEARGTDAPLIWAAGEGWHPGVVGIVAARLKEAFHRPAVVIGLEAGIGKGSGRSVRGIDLGAAVHRLVQDGALEKGGGHKMAAGLTVTQDKLDSAMAQLSELLSRQGADRLGTADLSLDGVLRPQAADLSLIEALEGAGPYGAAAPAPRFAFANMPINFAKRVGERHLKLRFGTKSDGPLEAIAFGAFETELGPTLERHQGALFHLAGRLERNIWQGRINVQLRLDDAAPA